MRTAIFTTPRRQLTSRCRQFHCKLRSMTNGADAQTLIPWCVCSNEHEHFRFHPTEPIEQRDTLYFDYNTTTRTAFQHYDMFNAQEGFIGFGRNRATMWRFSARRPLLGTRTPGESQHQQKRKCWPSRLRPHFVRLVWNVVILDSLSYSSTWHCVHDEHDTAVLFFLKRATVVPPQILNISNLVFILTSASTQAKHAFVVDVNFHLRFL